MGYENENFTPVILDVETVGRDGVADLLDPISAPRNLKDPAKIEAAIADKRLEQIERAGLNVNLLRIVALGLQLGNGEVHVQACRDEHDEALALEKFWARVTTPQGGVRPIITFNGHGFDLLVVQRRSLLLNLPYPKLNLKKFGNPHPDLMWILSEEGRLPFCSLAFYQRLFDIPVAANPLLDADAISGADIARLVAEGSSIAWAKICAHCHRDIELTAALARRIRVLPEAQPLAVQHGLFSAGRADA